MSKQQLNDVLRDFYGPVRTIKGPIFMYLFSVVLTDTQINDFNSAQTQLVIVYSYFILKLSYRLVCSF